MSRRADRLVKPYLELRKATLARDRGLREKVMTLEEAAALVNDGDTSASAAAPCRARRWR